MSRPEPIDGIVVRAHSEPINPRPPRGRRAWVSLWFIWRRRWTFSLLFLVSLAAGLVYLARVTPIYRAESRLYLQHKDLNLAAQAELIVSPPVLGRVMQMPALVRTGLLAGENPLARLRAALSVEVGADGVLSVALRSTDAEEAARLTNAVVEAYIRHQTQLQRPGTEEALRILQEEKKIADAGVEAAAAALTQFKEKNVEWLGTAQQAALQRQEAQSALALKNAAQALAKAKTEFNSAEKLLQEPEAARKVMETPALKGVAPSLVNEHARLTAALKAARLKRQQTLDAGVLPRHPGVRQIEAQIELHDNQLADVERKATEVFWATANERLSAARQREAEIRLQHRRHADAADVGKRKAGELAALEEKLKQAESQRTAARQRIQELVINEGGGAVNISVLSTASRPQAPVWPDRRAVMLKALLIGMGAGLLAALGHEMLGTRTPRPPVG